MRFNKYVRSVGVGLSVIALGGVTACGSAGNTTGATGTTGCETPVLAVLSLTGNSAAYSQPQKAGIDAAAKVINAAGGVNGCTLTVDYDDDNSDANQTLPAIQASMAKKDYAFVFTASYGTIGAIPYLAKKGVFTITGTGASKSVVNPQATPHIFEISPSVADSAAVVGKYATQKGSKQLGLITDNTSVGSSVADAFKKAVEGAGEQVADIEQVDSKTVDFTPVIQRLKAAGVQALDIDILSGAAAHALTAVRQAGWKVPVYLGQQATGSTNLVGLVTADDVKGTVMFGHTTVTLPYVSGMQKMLDQVAVNGAQKTVAGAPNPAANGYSALTVFAWGANQSKSTDSAAISAFLEKNTATAVPDLAIAVNTGYSPTSHVFSGTDSVAVWDGSLPNADGFFPSRTALLTPEGGPAAK